MSDDHHTEKEKGCNDIPISEEQEVHPNPRQSVANQDQQPSNRFSQISLDRKIELVLIVVGLVLAGLLWWTTQGQLKTMQIQMKEMEDQSKAMRDQVETAKDATRKSERAWVMVKDVRILGFALTGSKPSVRVEIQNTGHSPALSATITHYIVLAGKLPDGPMRDIEITDASHAVIGPNTSESSTVERKAQVTESEGTKLRDRKLTLFTFGMVKYFDIFGDQHRTTFCYFQSGNSSSSMTQCSKWNDAD